LLQIGKPLTCRSYTPAAAYEPRARSTKPRGKIANRSNLRDALTLADAPHFYFMRYF
jgi:hypothetical protein